MIELPTDLPSELVPLSWLLGVWEGTGVVDYDRDGERVQQEFGQRIGFSQDGLPYLSYSAVSWQLDDEAAPLTAETGYWRLGRAQTDADPGPAMLPARRGAARLYADAESVETLRGDAGGFGLEVAIVHPDGVSELYLGSVNGPRIDLATDAVVRAAGAKEYAAATRMYGLVDAHLLWAWDIAAFGLSMRSHASARLARVG